NLLLQIGNEVITVANFFINDGVSVYALDGIQFADGTQWDVDTIKAIISGVSIQESGYESLAQSLTTFGGESYSSAGDTPITLNDTLHWNDTM
ncbi:calcium-binding protein, partial [Pseudoalteromonas sp. T1lg88]|uniref:calcium-binding protein n=1 Tax=Pseudoalteromonas sp. T1lg88 TaxID=2077104 RepID=UPI00131A1B1C